MTSKYEAPPQEIFLRLSGAGISPWEIGRVQPVIIKLVQQGVFHGKVLDIGCGIADNAIYITTHAMNVNLTAIDLVSKATQVAREKAEKNNVNIQFEVVNMLEDISKTNLKQHSYNILLNAAIFHIFSDSDRLVYIKNLEYLIKAGGLYIQIVFSEKETHEGGPRRVKKSDINELFSSNNGWSIESIEDIIYELNPTTPLGLGARAYLSLIRRK